MDKGVNLDAMDIDDLREYQHRLDSQIRPMMLLVDYAKAKRFAMSFRLDGEIEAAIRYETECEVIYKQLPEEYRW